MKAKDMAIGTKVKWYSNLETGKVIANELRQGDEVVAVEWDHGYSVNCCNVNALIKID